MCCGSLDFVLLNGSIIVGTISWLVCGMFKSNSPNIKTIHQILYRELYNISLPYFEINALQWPHKDHLSDYIITILFCNSKGEARYCSNQVIHLYTVDLNLKYIHEYTIGNKMSK